MKPLVADHLIFYMSKSIGTVSLKVINLVHCIFLVITAPSLRLKNTKLQLCSSVKLFHVFSSCVSKGFFLQSPLQEMTCCSAGFRSADLLVQSKTFHFAADEVLRVSVFCIIVLLHD